MPIEDSRLNLWICYSEDRIVDGVGALTLQQAIMGVNVVDLILPLAIGLAGCIHVASMDVASRYNRGVAARDTVDRPSACSTSASTPGSAERVTHAQGYVGRLQDLPETVRARKAGGEASATDVAQVQARLADARARLARARADLAIARAELAAATGRPGRCPAIP